MFFAEESQRHSKCFSSFFSPPIKRSAAEPIEAKSPPSDSYSRFIRRSAAGEEHGNAFKLQSNFPRRYFQRARSSFASFTVTFAHGCPTSLPALLFIGTQKSPGTASTLPDTSSPLHNMKPIAFSTVK